MLLKHNSHLQIWNIQILGNIDHLKNNLGMFVWFLGVLGEEINNKLI